MEALYLWPMLRDGVIKGIIIIIWYRWLYDNVLFRVWTKARFRFPRLWMILGGFAWGYKSKIPVSRLPFMTKRHFCSAVKVPFRIYSKNNTDNPLFSLNLGSFESVLLASSFSEQRIEVVHFRAQLKLELLNLRAGFNSNFSTNIPHSFPTKSPPLPGKFLVFHFFVSPQLTWKIVCRCAYKFDFTPKGSTTTLTLPLEYLFCICNVICGIIEGARQIETELNLNEFLMRILD